MALGEFRFPQKHRFADKDCLRMRQQGRGHGNFLKCGIKLLCKTKSLSGILHPKRNDIYLIGLCPLFAFIYLCGKI